MFCTETFRQKDFKEKVQDSRLSRQDLVIIRQGIEPLRPHVFNRIFFEVTGNFLLTVHLFMSLISLVFLIPLNSEKFNPKFLNHIFL